MLHKNDVILTKIDRDMFNSNHFFLKQHMVNIKPRAKFGVPMTCSSGVRYRDTLFPNKTRCNIAVLGTANLHLISQPQISQNSNLWSATENLQVCGTLAR